MTETEAWLATDERPEFRYIKGLVTTNPSTMEAWQEGGIAFVALVPELEPRGPAVAWRWRHRRDEELGRWIYNDNNPDFANEFIETQALYLSPSPSVPDHYAALIQFAEFIRDGYARGDINHVDYRVGAYKAALDVLAAVGGSRE